MLKYESPPAIESLARQFRDLHSALSYLFHQTNDDRFQRQADNILVGANNLGIETTEWTW